MIKPNIQKGTSCFLCVTPASKAFLFVWHVFHDDTARTCHVLHFFDVTLTHPVTAVRLHAECQVLLAILQQYPLCD